MLPELSVVLNNINRSNVKSDKGLICLAVQDYYKTLANAGLIKRVKKVEPKKPSKMIHHMKTEELVELAKEKGIELGDISRAEMIKKVKGA